MLISTLLITGGLLLLLAGGEILLRGAVSLALLAKITPAVVGLTVVAAGTSVPELAVSVLASWRDQPDIAVGNVVGSNIFNLALILGISALVRPLVIRSNVVKLEYPVLVVVTMMFVALARHGSIARFDALLLLFVYVAFTVYVVSLVKAQLTTEVSAELQEEVSELEGASKEASTWTRAIGFVAVGSLLLGFGAHITVIGAVEVGKFFGLSDATIGLTIVACGTGLPEVVTSLVSTYRGRDDVAVANVIGSNLFNILVILGLSALVTPLHVPPALIASDNWWLLAITLGIFPILRSGFRISRKEALLLCAVYFLYIFLLLSQDAGNV